MPPFNTRRYRGWISICVLAGASMVLMGQPAAAESTSPVSIRSRQVELHYQTSGAGNVDVELWYTRDRGITWQCVGREEDRKSPLIFTAPGEGLYGLVMIAYVNGKPTRPTPKAHDVPQRWVFVDATPPLAQWNGVEPADDFANNRKLQLRWTAYDANLITRPIKLLYQSSIDQKWQAIDDHTTNTGVYDWKVPETVGGQVTLKLLVTDQGGHVVERPFGPISLEKMAAVAGPAKDVTAAASAQSQPALAKLIPTNKPGFLPDIPVTATRPAAEIAKIDPVKKRLADDLYRQGIWHLDRGQYSVAAERLHEALEQNPGMLEAHQDLAGIFYRQQDYDKAVAEYETILSKNDKHESALYGAALALVAKRDYHRSREMLTRLLTVNDRNAEAWFDLGDVLFLMGDPINARANWRRAAKVDPAAKEIIEKAQRRLEQYGMPNELAKK